MRGDLLFISFMINALIPNSKKRGFTWYVVNAVGFIICCFIGLVIFRTIFK